MEQWQFLIQKEGERTWHPLEKSSIQITEGRYRVVARSNRINTDVEVRVTHSSPSEVPPIRRIQKRRRQINSEGLTAVIPFTYLKPGIWELQCYGDLMSDLLGASWQYTVNLTVIPARVEGKIVSSTNKQQSKIKNPQSKRNSSFSSKDVKTNDAGLISSISIEPAPSTSGNIAGNIASSDKAVGQNSKEKLRESLKAASDKQKPVSKKSPKKPLQKLSTTQNKTVSQKPVPKVRDSVKGLSEKAVKPANNAAKSNKTKVKKEATQSPDKKTTTLNQAVSEKSVQKSSAKPKASNKKNNTKDVSQKLAPKGDLAIIEPNSSPVRVKGDTAEQILQNLIELALPSNEALLPDDSIDDTLTTPAPLPLQLTLDKVNHVATWGETITVEGLAEPKQTTDLQIKQIAHAELEIELRSPQSSQLLQSFRLPNPNKLLPFAIACLINIPEECASKLIIGEVKLYGALDNRGAKKLLASQSFTITAEIKELLAITVANPKGELEKFADYSDQLSARNSSQILEDSAPLDLELFNLVKTIKPEEQSVTGVPSNKKSLPPRVEPQKFPRRVGKHSLKLPNVPGYQEKIDEYINHGYIETGSNCDATDTSFPYLRKLKELPCSFVEVDEDVVEYQTEESTYTKDAQTVETEIFVETDESSQAELVNNSYVEFQEPVTPRNSELIAEGNLNTSPLIRQWMLSQGYSLPEPIDVEYEDYDYDIEASNQEISHQQVSPSPQFETDENSQVLHQEKAQKAQIDIQTTPSPYLSISTSSQWQVNQITAPSNQIAQEIVVEDDTDIFADDILTAKSPEPDEPTNDLTQESSALALTIGSEKIEDLPTPQIYLPKGELISGKTLNVRVRLPEGNSHLAVKLWLEDCQTRHLLDGPHLLTNLTPNKNQELEVITKLNIPFGCIEIRLEAVAINRSTQQESHKFTIQRTVVPPDLPNVQFDAILGM